MKISKNLTLLALTLGCMTAANAVPILITGLDITQFPSFADDNVQTGVNAGIAAWNAANDPDLPTAGIGATPDVKLNSGDAVSGFPSFGANTLSITLPMGDYNYVFLHWGGPNDDVNYKNPQLYYVGDETGSYSFNAPIHTIPAQYFTSGPKAGQLKSAAEEKQYGLSFYSYYSEIPNLPPPTTSVPDAGSNLGLLGLGMLGVVGLRRFGRRQ
jgi:hypothetical protein